MDRYELEKEPTELIKIIGSLNSKWDGKAYVGEAATSYTIKNDHVHTDVRTLRIGPDDSLEFALQGEKVLVVGGFLFFNDFHVFCCSAQNSRITLDATCRGGTKIMIKLDQENCSNILKKQCLFMYRQNFQTIESSIQQISCTFITLSFLLFLWLSYGFVLYNPFTSLLLLQYTFPTLESLS
ncbi:hypothetical protein METBIDRAFT_30128 [Metschnikowia bicuspidata var. bicuspidata NRRL YB-4993]|uniref:Uncharacterized protein n=1 Tax=Metschnikowia bicuspidata var. bicuspidata NRRL YB-4993 TaxID=869754 RepID=A0A1A0HIP2_9ASCO|nr:hypothetical protein METBIDRAFT_30128 [Metschnikowia bicuspidata var. bicuspidata NRRL YB-4993]OBA23708.1 hypothetical protein METBIDRAFT_30128 [Metschnikowia bicuspidata var. bicuspidata NRRL YB-4993]